MNIFDFILLMPPAYFCYLGIRKGLVKRILAILGLFVGAFVSYYYHDETMKTFSKIWDISGIEYIAYIIPFIATVLFVKLVASIITKGLKVIALSPLNVFLGAIFGIIQGTLLSAAFAVLALLTNSVLDTPLMGLTKGSLLFNYSEQYLNDLIALFSVSV